MQIDRTELQDVTRRVLQNAGLAPDCDTCWRLAVNMGWLALRAPEELGGLGQGRVALCALFYEFGRALAPITVLPAMQAFEPVAKADGGAGQAAWAERLIQGERVSGPLAASAVMVRPMHDGFHLTGELHALPDADQATHFLVCAGGVIGLLPRRSEGLTVNPNRVWDRTRRLFDVRLEGVTLPANLVLARGEAAADLARDLEVDLLFALASDSLGAAGALFEMTIDYLKTRRQFSRPLAMFQALKHRCANLKAQLAAAEALLWQCANSQVTPAVDALAQAGGMKAHADMVAHAVAEEAIQLHGGIGLTAEHPAHLYVKRLLLNESLAGHADCWEQAVGDQAIGNLKVR